VKVFDAVSLQEIDSFFALAATGASGSSSAAVAELLPEVPFAAVQRPGLPP